MHISVVLGTAREGRRSEQVAKLIFETFKRRGNIDTTYVDVRDHLTTFWTTRFGKEDAHKHAWHGIAAGSDGFVFVIPEYNRGYPGEWKLLMDSLYKSEYMAKVGAFVGVSNGNFGASRAVEQGILSLSNRGMYVMKDTLYFPRVNDLFDENEILQSEEQMERVETFVDAFTQTVSRFLKVRN